MAASYPGAIKSFSQQTDLVSTIDAADINEAYDEIEAIQTELGTNPKSIDDTVAMEATPADIADVLDQFANAIKTITGAANWYSTTGVLPSGGWAAKGDILSASAADTPVILTVGARKYGTLYADSAQSSGLAWGRRRYVVATVVNYIDDCATGDGQYYFHVPAHLDSFDLVEVHAECITAGTTGTMDVQIHNVDNALDMLSTKLTIDSGETGSDTAAAAAVINTSNDHVNTNDMLRIDIDAVHTTAAQGLIVTLGFA
jgi:hypothetical protein